MPALPGLPCRAWSRQEPAENVKHAAVSNPGSRHAARHVRSRARHPGVAAGILCATDRRRGL